MAATLRLMQQPSAESGSVVRGKNVENKFCKILTWRIQALASVVCGKEWALVPVQSKFLTQGTITMAKKKPAKKAKKAAKIGISEISNLELSMPLDEKKIQEIQKCLAKGELKLKVSKVNLGTGKIGDAWLYD